jgi:DNA-binding transcriptional ArsR family regulator
VTAVFEALADPIRRRIMELLAGGEWSAGDIAAEFAISRPGVSRHLRVLRESGLVRARGEGQRRLYSVDPGPLAEVEQWLARYRGFWAQRLDALDTEVVRARRVGRSGPAAGGPPAESAGRAT